MALNEQSPSVNRYLTEGICPTCHIPLLRTANLVAACKTCDFVWRSKRIPQIFPSKEDNGHGP